tara:strand:- start:1181 stop:1375 length:195 start_codon:yes stop_codon:yes gene_type:complete
MNNQPDLPMTFNRDLTVEFDGAVLMNESAKRDRAVMAALTALQENNWMPREVPTGGVWHISDRH